MFKAKTGVRTPQGCRGTRRFYLKSYVFGYCTRSAQIVPQPRTV
jgi:hypothetical protein